MTLPLFARRLAAAGLVVTAIGAGAGCDGAGRQTASAAGTVTYDGKPVEAGTITFLPDDGVGQPAGGPVTGGRYSVPGLVPGKKIVTIEAGAASRPSGPISTADLAKEADEAKKRGETPGAELAVPLRTAVGNNAKLEVKEGPNALDFQLLPAAAPKK